MPITPLTPPRRVVLSAAALLAVGLTVPLAAQSAVADDAGLVGSTLYVDPFSTTLESAQGLSGQARDDAQLLGSIASATWFTDGTPDEVRAGVDAVVGAAAARGEMPVIVAYDIPFRDCALYSAGGAADTAAYEAWIDAFAAGIGDRPATVILEPDGLGVIPHYTTLAGELDSCQPSEVDPTTASSDRFAQLNHAVDALKAQPRTSVYLDGTSSAWLSVPEISSRLVKAGVERADGFFLNVSNYQFTANGTWFGTWVSQCVAYATKVNPGGYGECGQQYWNGGPANEWQGVAMSQYGEWTHGNADPALDTSGVESRFDLILGDVQPTAHFVIDTSRNGLGPWAYPAGIYAAHEDWCNPPGRGTGALPTTATNTPLVDAYLWIKVPGESDGKCYRGTVGPTDPARGMEDPAAGQWFVEQARELVALGNPALAPLTCDVTVVGTKVGSGFAAALSVKNSSTDTLRPWKLSWAFDADQRVKTVVGGSFTQQGAAVTVTAPRLLPSLAPGKRASLALVGSGAATAPWQFTLNDKACTSHTAR